MKVTIHGDDEVFAGRRDASWFRNPGVAWRYHVQRSDGWPACGMVAFLTAVIVASDVPANLRCKRRGCKERWGKK